MVKKEVVETFLNKFHTKFGIWSIIFRDDRAKNTQALLDLEITPIKRTDIIKGIKITDYSEGPIDEKINGGSEMWVFGKMIKDKEIYIKITLGFENTSVICISFHIAEHKMKYPFK